MYKTSNVNLVWDPAELSTMRFTSQEHSLFCNESVLYLVPLRRFILTYLQILKLFSVMGKLYWGFQWSVLQTVMSL